MVRYPYRETMRNNDKQWCVTVFLQPVRKRLMSSFYVTAPLALWLTPPPSLPNHISYISKPNNALILLFLLNIMIIIIFLGNPKQPVSRKTFPKILLKPWIIVSCIYSIYCCTCLRQCNLYDDDDDYYRVVIIIIFIIIYYYYCYYYYCYYNNYYYNSRVFIWMLKV